jgi:hypothetical protein
MEAETAVTLLQLPEQHPIPYPVARNLERLARNSNHKTSYNVHAYKEKIILNGILEKLHHNNAIITKADT